MNTISNAIFRVRIGHFRTPDLRVVDEKHLLRTVGRQAGKFTIELRVGIRPLLIGLERAGRGERAGNRVSCRTEGRRKHNRRSNYRNSSIAWPVDCFKYNRFK